MKNQLTISAPKNRWLPLVLITLLTIAIFIISIISLLSGWQTIFQNLFYIPIILACMYYVKRGFIFSVLLACGYFVLMAIFSQDFVVLEGAFIRVLIFILVAGVITYLSIARIRAEDALKESEERYSTFFYKNYSISLLIDPDTGIIADANSAAGNFYGYSLEQLTRMRISDLNRLSQEKVLRDLHKAKNERERHFFTSHFLANGKQRFVEIYSGPISVRGKTLLYSVVHDITDRRIAEQALRESEARLNAVIKGSPLPQFVIDRDHKVIHWNKALEDQCGIRADEVIGTNQQWQAFYTEERPCMADLLVDGTIERIPQWYSGKYRPSRLVDGAYEATDFFPHMGKSGTWLHFTAVPIKDNKGEIIGAIETLDDITERKSAEEALQNSKVLLNEVGEMAHVGGWELDIRTKAVHWTQETYRIHDISQDEKFDLSKVVLFFDLPGRTKLEAALQRCMETGEPFDLELPFTSAKGRHLWTRAMGRAVNVSGTVVKLTGTFQDITEQKKTELQVKERVKELQAFYGLAEITEKEGITPDQLCQEFVNLLPKSWKYPEIACSRIVIGDSEFCTNNFTESAWKQSAPVRVQGSVVGKIEVGYLEERPEQDEGLFLKEERLLLEALAERLGRIIERERTAEALLKSLREKDLLVKEIHHRVKNNLQTIASLLYLQSLSSDDKQIKILLNEVRSRVNAMGLIHQKLYQSTDISRVPFTDYINLLIDSLKESYGIDTTKIRFFVQVKPENLSLDIDTGIPCGLIINELVTNTLKYAFRNRPGGTITIQMSRDEQHQYLLSVSDDGGGIPAELDISQLKSLGMTIVSSLVRQLSGTMEIVREPGTTIFIRFPVQAPHTSDPLETAKKPAPDEKLSIDEKIKRIREKHG